MIEYVFGIYSGATMKVYSVEGMKVLSIREPEGHVIEFMEKQGVYTISSKVKQNPITYSSFYLKINSPLIYEDHINKPYIVLKDTKNSFNIVLDFRNITNSQWAKDLILKELHNIGFVQ